MPDQKTILLVEDEALIALSEAMALRKDGYHVVIANSGEDALDIVQPAGGGIDLILMDINLGHGMDGTQAAQEILKDHDIPIIFLSSHTEPWVVEKTEKITAYGYVVKNTGAVLLLHSIKMAFKLYAAHRTIRHTNHQLNLALTSSAAATWDWDLLQDRIEWSGEFSKIFGIAPDPQGGIAAWTNAIHPDDRAQVEQLLQEAIHSQTDLHSEYRILLGSQEVRWVSTTGRTFSEGGRPTRILGLCIDITGRKLAEEALRQRDKQYFDLFEHMAEGYAYCQMIFENGMAQDWIYLAANQAFTELTGLRDVVGRRVTEVIPNIREADPELFEVYARVSLTGQPEKIEIYVNALSAWFSVSVYSPQTGYFVAVFDVITRRKQQEQALYAGELEHQRIEAALKRLLQEKELLVREVQHRVKNSLNTAAGLLGLELDQLPDARSREIFTKTQARILAMGAIYNQLYQSEEADIVNLHQYIHDLIANISQSYLAGGAPVQIVADLEETRLGQRKSLPVGIILNELITNALKYAFPAGWGSPGSPAVIRVELTRAGGEVRLCVADNGVGINESTGGGGMGLELVKMLAGQIGGCLTMEKAGGCAMCITFPET